MSALGPGASRGAAVALTRAAPAARSTQVTYTLDRDCFLSVEARDMDTERHKLWLQRGEIVVLRS